MSQQDALSELAALLRGDDSVVSPHVREPEVEPLHGALAAAGPRSASAPGEYALIVEAVREGYLLHYGAPRIVRGTDPDLSLLAGDYLYALGLDRLAGLGDLDAVRELADLISLVAQVHDGARDAARAARESDALWLAAACAVGTGPTDAHEAAKAALRAGSPDAAARLVTAARDMAAGPAAREAVERAGFSIDFAADQGS